MAGTLTKAGGARYEKTGALDHPEWSKNKRNKMSKMNSTYPALAKIVTMTGEQIEAVASVTEQLFIRDISRLLGGI